MKYFSCRFFLFCCIGLCLAIPEAALSTPVGNIGDPACLTTGLFTYERPNGLFTSLEADFVSNRVYKHQSGDFTLKTYGARIGGIIRDKLMLYGFAGLSEYSDSKSIGEYDTPDLADRSELVARIRIKANQDIIYGGGISAIMFEHKVNEGVFFRIGLDASYRRIELSDDNAILRTYIYNRADTTTRGYAFVPGAQYELTLNDYQGAVEVSYQIDEFTPYFGFIISESRGSESIHVPADAYYDYENDIRLDYNKGFFAGMSYNYNKKISLAAEVRTRSETAFTFSTVMRF